MTHPCYVADHVSRDWWLQHYVTQGMRVHPCFEVMLDGTCACGRADCPAVGKHPRLGAWQHAATTDVSTIRRWVEQWPGANWAWALDVDDLVIDCDPRNGGPRTEQFSDDWRARFGFDPPATLYQQSGSGGLHVVRRCPEGFGSGGRSALWLPDGSKSPGINVKGLGGYILVEPSNHTAGRFYRWLEWTRPTELTEEERRLLERPAHSERRSPGQSGGGQGTGAFQGPDEWLRGAAEVAAGEQRDYLLSGIGWLRDRGRSLSETMALACVVAERLVCYREGEPWTAADVSELVTDVYDRYEATLEGDVVIPRQFLTVIEGGQNGRTEEPVARQVPVDVGERQRNTDYMNAHDLAARYSSQLVYTPESGWLCWDGNRWALDDLGHARFLASELGQALWREQAQVEEEQRETLRQRNRRLESADGIASCLRVAQDLPVLKRHQTEFDQHPWLLNCGGRTLDLSVAGWGAREPRPEDLLTRWCPTEYDPEARSELLDEYLDTFVPGEQRREVLFRVLGSTLVGGNPWRNLVLLLGPTTTGKSQLASALEQTLGDYVGIGGPSLFRGNLDDKPRPDLLRVMPCRVALCEEAGHQWQLHEDKVKQITGGGTMQARRMRSDTFLERVPEFTPVVVANSVPRVKGSDLAVYQRLVVVRFDQRPAVEDVSKRAAFVESEDVHRALLRRLVEGCFRAQQVGASADDLPHEFQVERAVAFDDLDDVKGTLTLMQEHQLLRYDASLSANQSARTKELYSAYRSFVEKYGDADQRRELLGIKQFSQRLAQLPGFERGHSSAGSVWTGWQVVDPLLWRPS